MINSTQILQKYWGHSSFRFPQEAIIEAANNGNDTIALLPTGGGKSICFQIPALAKEGICIVISPLIALMEDQVNSLLDKDIKATTIPSGSTQDEMIILFDKIRFANYKFLYLSPERLQSTFIQEKIRQLNVNLIAIDEAHCISEWGHDFRPSYRNINILRALKPTVNCIALTATATNKVIDDIKTSLEMKAVKIFRKSFFRKNLAYQIYQTEDKLYQLKQIFRKTKSPAIVYVNTRSKTKEISNYLTTHGFNSTFYHGGLSAIEKQASFQDWMTEKKPIIVATNAFGMGIDKPNVGIVIHLNLPSSIENYIQEAGRAGRNGKKAFSVVLQNKNDQAIFKELIIKSYPNISELKEIHQKLYQHFQIVKGEYTASQFDLNLLEFSNKYNFSSNKVFNSLQILHNNGVLQSSENTRKKSTVKFLVKSKYVLTYIHKNNTLHKFIQTFLRIYGGVFEEAIKIDEFYLAKKTGITSWKTIEYLNKLADDNLISYIRAAAHTELTFLLPREDDITINRISKHVKTYLNQKKQKVDDVINFITNNDICRSIQLLSYFGEKKLHECDFCDVCLNNKKIENISDKILSLIQKNKEMSSREICASLSAKEQDILINLQYLLAEEKIAINSYNKYYI
ncbi:ATP-dependent DNA helicase RecQ [Tenacibaculum maritimum]|uniref:RecQ family ATP-dependent DNA helicase n=1 Tax=Tenacibaculum maritimum TaxID=107401 RepID=UPI0023072124|nr:ATP-dependent DNA helicase RecQ [Tenacibaculum maritimum]MDB0613050.1 RecQ family ATP-dependent DNA helicase [Tenacibaculum maritimum]